MADKQLKVNLVAVLDKFMAGLDNGVKAVGRFASKVAAGMAGASKAAGDLGKNIGAAVDKGVRHLKRLALGVSAVAVALGKLGVDFEKQMAEVSTMLTADTMHLLPKLSDGIRRLSRDLGQSTETLAKGAYDFLSAGVSAEKVLDSLAAAGKAAVGGITETGTAAKAIVRMTEAYKGSLSGATDASDLLFAIVAKGITTFGELAEHIGLAAGSASQAGFKMEEMAAALAVASKTLPMRQAITGLQAVARVFVGATDEQKAAARAIGIELSDTTLRTKGYTWVLEQLKTKLAQTSIEQRYKLVLSAINAQVAQSQVSYTKASDALKKYFSYEQQAKKQGKTLNANHKAIQAIDAAMKGWGLSVKDSFGRLVTASTLMSQLNSAYAAGQKRMAASRAEAEKGNVTTAGAIKLIFQDSEALRFLNANLADTAGYHDALKLAINRTGQAEIAYQKMNATTAQKIKQAWQTVLDAGRSVGTGIKDEFDKLLVAVAPRLKSAGEAIRQWFADNGKYFTNWLKQFGDGIDKGLLQPLKKVWALLEPIAKKLGALPQAMAGGPNPQLLAARKKVSFYEGFQMKGAPDSTALAAARQELQALEAQNAGAIFGKIGEAVGSLVKWLLILKGAVLGLAVLSTVLAVGGKLIAVFVGVAKALVWVVGAIAGLVGAVGAVPVAIGAAVVAAIALIVYFRETIWNFITTVAGAVWQGITWVGQALWSVVVTIGKVASGILWWIGEIEGWIAQAIYAVASALVNLGVWIVQKMAAAIAAVGAWLAGLLKTIWDWIAGLPGRVWGAVSSAVSSILNSIWGLLTAWWEKIKSWVSNGWEWVKNKLGFTTKGSPSLKDVLTDTMQRSVDLVANYGARLGDLLHGAAIGPLRMETAGAMLGGGGGATHVATTNTVNLSAPVNVRGGMIDERWLREGFLPQLQRAIDMGLVRMPR